MNKNLAKKYKRFVKGTKGYSNFLEALIVSTTMALLMLGLAFGLIYMDKKGTPIPDQYLLLIFAITFIIGSVFFEKQKFNRITSLIYGGLFSASVTFVITAIVGGLIYITKTRDLPATSVMISALAVCMIISMVITNVLSYE